MTSTLFPWAGEYSLEALPDYEDIAAALAQAGELARALRQRLTTHPPHYVKLASQDAGVLGRSMRNLELHSQARPPPRSPPQPTPACTALAPCIGALLRPAMPSAAPCFVLVLELLVLKALLTPTHLPASWLPTYMPAYSPRVPGCAGV